MRLKRGEKPELSRLQMLVLQTRYKKAKHTFFFHFNLFFSPKTARRNLLIKRSISLFVGFKCTGCGVCCKNITETNDEGEEIVSKKIPIYPEEADRLEEIAELRGIDDLKIVEDFVIPDKKSQKILVIRYKYMLKEGDYCVFSDPETRKCTVYDIRPLVCRSYPISFRDVDAFNKEILLDPDCPGVTPIINELKEITAADLKENFVPESFWAKKLFEREKRSIEVLKQMEYLGEISLEDKFTYEEFNNALLDWERKIIEIDDTSYFLKGPDTL
jgi:Fe-S-cluster containining protein